MPHHHDYSPRPPTTPFLVDLHASSQRLGLGKSGGDDNTKRPMKEMPHRQLLSHSEGAQLWLENRQHDLRLRRQFSVPIEWR